MMSNGTDLPQPIAEFRDDYIRNEDLIRPKPRRLVDMRRVGIGNEHSAFLQSPEVHPGFQHKVPSSQPSPPVLPVKPTAHLQLKPLPPPPVSSTKNYKYFNNPMTSSSPVSHGSGSHAQPQQAQYHNSAAVLLNLSRGSNNSGTPPMSNLIPRHSSAPPYNTQRSVPNLAEKGSGKRLFLSPQPTHNDQPYFGCGGPITGRAKNFQPPNYSNSGDNGHYYEECFQDVTQIKDTRPRSTVHGDWKSVENLPQSFSIPPRLCPTSPGAPENYPMAPQIETSKSRTSPSTAAKNLHLNFNSKIMKSYPDFTQIRIEENGCPSAQLLQQSPEYERIQTPPPESGGQKVALGVQNELTVTTPSSDCTEELRSHGHQPDFMALRRSTTPEQREVSNFQSILENGENSKSSDKFGSGGSGRKGMNNKNQQQSVAPSSKLKSRRRNILQHLSLEQMTALNGGSPGREDETPGVILGANNTGTGGSSSSEASSGHASMSDSQASGSPPAPADYSKLTGSPAAPIITNFKSVLKSVPEDESGLRNFINEKSQAGDSGNRSAGSSHNSSGKKGSKSSSRHHRNRDNSSLLLLGNGSSGLEDIKQAIEQLTLRSYHSGSSGGILNENRGVKGHHSRQGDHNSSYSTSTYSSMSGSECDRQQRRQPHHLLRHSSLETINTQVTSADEFVWVDSHNRLVELQNVPWSNHDILKVIERSSRLRDSLERISMETVPRISYLLQRAFVRIAREAQRLSKPYGFCTKQEISSAFRIVLSPSTADSCIKSCLRAAAMFSVSANEPLHKESKSVRAGVNLHVGRFQRWMCEVRLGRFVHEFAAIHLTAGIENLIEELLGQALTFITSGTEGTHQVLTATLLEKAIANNGDLWGLLQPFAHLNAGRTASGALALPRWASVASMDSTESSTTTIGGNQDEILGLHHNKSLEQSILTTCVGSTAELSEILNKVSQYHHRQIPISNGNRSIVPTWSPAAVQTLFYFMRCSQLECSDEVSSNNLASSTATLGEVPDRPSHHQVTNHAPVQELVYERPFIVLPPLIEWVRVTSAHTEHRHSSLIDRDDVMQAARLLLPGIDCPPRLLGIEEVSFPRRPIDEFEVNRRLKINLGFKMLGSGRSDLIAQALLLFPPGTKANTFNESGMSPLILSSLRGEDGMVRKLLESGADPDAETPVNNSNFPNANNEVQHWTALTFASLVGNASMVKLLLERGGNVEGGAKLSEEKSTQTPLQVAAATGNLEIVNLLLNYGASPFLSTLVRDSLCYMGSASRGSFSAISVAAAHGQRAVLHKLLSHPIHPAPPSKEVLSLEEILAEGAPVANNGRGAAHAPNNGRLMEDPKLLTKSQLKLLQEAMYQSAENGHLEITLDFRSLGVPWTLHCWVNALGTAYELRCESVVEQLLQDFGQILPNEDFAQTQFVEECLPLLFTVFRNSKIKNDSSMLLLGDIFQTCYGKEPIKEIRDTTISNGTRIDPKYVNNPELSDVQFRVEGKVFYAHKIVLVTSSPRFKSMLKSAPESNPPVLQINDIRYHIFQMVMEFLYNGGCDTFRLTESEEILELMAAANFFQLDGLLRFCETKCSQLVNIESLVSLYIHAKVYNAVQLLEYCQGFMLQNMVQALTLDDSVRKLIFGKRLHNHDVLAGLLLTMQARLKTKPNAKPSNCPAPSLGTSSTPPYLYPSRKYK